jgi:hypothetical protein
MIGTFIPLRNASTSSYWMGKLKAKHRLDKRQYKAGEILLVEDTEGKGHKHPTFSLLQENPFLSHCPKKDRQKRAVSFTLSSLNRANSSITLFANRQCLSQLQGHFHLKPPAVKVI